MKARPSCGPLLLKDESSRESWHSATFLSATFEQGHADHGVALVMVDRKLFVQQTSEKREVLGLSLLARSQVLGGIIDIPSGGKSVSVELGRQYAFD